MTNGRRARSSSLTVCLTSLKHEAEFAENNSQKETMPRIGLSTS